MGNAFFRFIGCVDTEIIEYSREGGFDNNDNIKLVGHLGSVELEVDDA